MQGWRSSSWYRDTVFAVICASLVLTPFFATITPVYADEVIDEANKGQDTGANLLLNYQVPSINNGPAGDPLGPNEVGIQDIFPGFDPNDPTAFDSLTDLLNDPTNLATQGVAKEFELSGGATEEAEAYQGVVGGSNNPNNATVDIRNDNFLDRTRDILTGNDPILDEILTACAEDVTAGDPGTDTVTRLEDVYTCSQLRTGLTGSCTVDRDFVLAPVATQTILAVLGGVCVPGSGNDVDYWLPLGWNEVRQGVCATPAGTSPGNHVARLPEPLGGGLWMAPQYCGDRETDNPTVATCTPGANRLENACRNESNSSEMDASRGAVGSCTSYDDTDRSAWDTTKPDYTDCDTDRQNYCEAAATEFMAECVDDDCGGSCGSGNDIDFWSTQGWTTYPGSRACVDTGPTAPGNHIGRMFAGGGGQVWVSPQYCGDRETENPTVASCTGSATFIENVCRDELNAAEMDTSRGPIGTCSTPNPTLRGQWSSVAPDYTDCDADRQAYCEAAYDEYIVECSGECSGSCESVDNVALYNYGSTWPNDGPLKYCRTFLPETFNYTPTLSDLDYNGRTFAFAVREPVGAGDYILRGFSTDACGSTPEDCTTLGINFEVGCNGGGGFTTLYPSFPPIGDVPTYCASQRAVFEANCAAANSCIAGGGAASLLTGTDTFTAPGLGPGYVEVLPAQPLLGTTVNFEVNGFNPGDYGLAAGEYVISDHTISGNGITSSTIDDHGSYGSNWDYTATLTAVDSDGFTVDATLYEIVSNGFIFTGCSQADVQNVESGACTGSVTCTDYTPPCRVVDGVTLCEPIDPTDGITEVLSPWTDFTTAVPEMCWSADVNIVDCLSSTNCVGNPACVADCDDLPPALQPACQADACWIDAQGTEICLDDTSEAWVNNLGDQNYVDDCLDLINDPACSLMPDVACIEGMEDPANPNDVDLCLLRQRFFDCGTDITVPGTPGADDVDVTCGAEIRCIGDECSNTEVESNPDFNQAAVAATTLTESTKDMECDVEGDPLTCKIFEGTDNRCKDPRGSYLGIIPDCCKQARDAAQAAGDFALYMQLAVWSFRLARDPMVASWLAQGQVLPSALQNVVNAPGNVANSVGRVVTSGFNSALEWAGLDPINIATQAAAEQGAVAASATGFGPLQQFIATGFQNFLNSIGANQLATDLFTTTSEGTVTDWAADGVGEMVGNIFGVIMLIYTIYNIIKILGNIIFACEEEELAFGIQLVNRACHHVGTYCSKKVSVLGLSKCIIETQTHCCFSSPFARIINEQLREQGIGPDWGTAKEPNCEGIAISELENVDWDLVDLSEWEAILFEAGLVPDPRNPPLNFIPTDRHPGDASGGSEGMTSTDIMTETIDAVMPDFSDARFNLNGGSLNQPDPELMPWYDDGT